MPTILTDSDSAKMMVGNELATRRTKHLDVRSCYVKQQFKNRVFELGKILGKINPADSFTKPVGADQLKKLFHMEDFSPN